MLHWVENGRMAFWRWTGTASTKLKRAIRERTPLYILRGLENGKCTKKSWYQYIFSEIALGQEHAALMTSYNSWQVPDQLRLPEKS
jgi:hypothetical protein